MEERPGAPTPLESPLTSPKDTKEGNETGYFANFALTQDCTASVQNPSRALLIPTFPPTTSILQVAFMFTFKRFTIHDEHCAMKVGTDGVLLGAWAGIDGACRVLDIGCGSGLIALMAAQRNASAQVTGVEIDENAVRDAITNIQASPFADRVRVIHADILQLAGCDTDSTGGHAAFDCLLANPPYHEEELLPPSAARATARHTSGGLTFSALLETATTLLAPDVPTASLSVVLPAQASSAFIPLAGKQGLYVSRRTDVITRPGKPPKRILLEFRLQPSMPVCEQLILMDEGGKRSKAYSDLCRDFYIK